MWYSVFLQKILKNWLKVKWIISLHGNYRGIYFAVKNIQCSVYELSYPFLLPSLQDLKLSLPLHSICWKDLHWTFFFFFSWVFFISTCLFFSFSILNQIISNYIILQFKYLKLFFSLHSTLCFLQSLHWSTYAQPLWNHWP